MRIFGAVLIAAAFLGAGLTYMHTKKRRIKALRDLIAALERIQGELSARNTPLSELWELALERAQGAAKDFFETLSDSMRRLGQVDFTSLWKEAAKIHLCVLDTDELEEFIRLGDMLGRYALAEQLNALKLCCAGLRKGLETAQSDYPGQRRLGLGLGTAAGLLLIIVLL